LFPEIRRSFYRFLALYIFSTALLIGIGEYLYYRYASHRIIDREVEALERATQKLIFQLKRLHQSFSPTLTYPKIEGIESALYDIEKNYLIGTFSPSTVHWDRKIWVEGGKLYKVTPIYPYYLGAAYVVTATSIDEGERVELKRELLLFSLFSLSVIVVTALFLGRLFLAPAQQSIALLDRFIKDATHELNTPISTILTNIELFKELHPEFEGDEELRRIELASKRLSRIFEDLAFIQLHHRIAREIREVRIDQILKETLDYFRSQIDSKGITLSLHLEPTTLLIDPNDAQTLLDNLISNAIKYNRQGGSLQIRLSQKELLIRDSGIGIGEEDLERVTDRFFRVRGDQEGGFGLGLFIVREIVAFYRFSLKIKSQLGVGTEVIIQWNGS